MSKGEETYYEILKVEPRATVAEIVAAYHSAKNAFSKDSVATYSLFNPEEVQVVLAKLEEAYLTLSNLEKRSIYDKELARAHKQGEVPNLTELDKLQNVQQNSNTRQNEEFIRRAETGAPPELPLAVNLEDINGAMFKDIRERRGLSVEDVCRITKIPSRFLNSLEGDQVNNLPARVYVQGFIKNMAVLYKLDAKITATSYLNYLDKMTKKAA